MALNQLPWVEKPTTLPPVHRYITSHRPDGTSTVLSSPDQLYRGAPGVLGVSRSYAVESVPAKLDASQDVEKYMSEDTESNPTSRRLLDIVASNQRGVVMTVVDFGPGQSSSMHQTVSIDFSICVIGAIDCELDSGEIVHLNAGVSTKSSGSSLLSSQSYLLLRHRSRWNFQQHGF